MSLASLSGQRHVVQRVSTEGALSDLPPGWTARLVVLVENEDDEPRPFWPLYDYLQAKWGKSDAWQVDAARALGLFWDFTTALGDREPEHFKGDLKYDRVLKRFSSALLNGTIRDGTDPLGLYWMAQPVDVARRIINALRNFAQWLVDEIPGAPPRIRNWQRDQRLTEFTRQAHLNRSIKVYPSDKEPKGRAALPDSGGRDGRAEAPITFPAHAVESVLWDGFRRRGAERGGWDDFHVDQMMVFLLQAFAGLREHEAFHMWTCDIAEDPTYPGRASVALYHPEHGLAYIDGLDGKPLRTNRRQLLRDVYGLPPRTRGSGSYKIGWKRGAVGTPDYTAILHWTDPTAGMLFLELYRYYTARRSKVMVRRRGLGLMDHPFLFVSEQEARNLSDGYKFIGAPAGIPSYENGLARAVQTVGLPYGKEFGTTSHGLRHLYASTIRRMGVGRKTLQSTLRHKNPGSSDRYGIPSAAEISDSLNNAFRSGSLSLPEGLRLERTYQFIMDKHPEYEGGIL